MSQYTLLLTTQEVGTKLQLLLITLRLLSRLSKKAFLSTLLNIIDRYCKEKSLKLWILATEEKSKQNITRDIEVKNDLTIARGEWGGDSEERGLQELLQRTHGQNQGGRWEQGREVGMAGVGWRDGEKRHTTVIE